MVVFVFVFRFRPCLVSTYVAVNPPFHPPPPPLTVLVLVLETGGVRAFLVDKNECVVLESDGPIPDTVTESRSDSESESEP